MMQIGYRCSSDALRLFAWHEVDNFGDRLGPALFHQISGRPVCIEARGLQPTFQGQARQIHCFLGTLAQALRGPHHFILWGFGTSPATGPAHHGCQPMEAGLDLEVRALRGPLTHKVLTNAGYRVPDQVPYGDPGLLIPYFYKRSPFQMEDFCLVPHHSDYDEWRWKFPGFNVVDIRLPSYEALGPLISAITRYKVIFTSSLHVTILAEAFGIPVQPMSPKLPFKFDDFYGAVGKTLEYLPAPSVETDWPSLYETTIRNWRPIRWDPRPWLAAAPFPISPGIGDRLARHYRALARRKRPYGILGRVGIPFGARRLPADLCEYYTRLNESLRHADPLASELWNTLRVFSPSDWTASGADKPPVIGVAGGDISLNADGNVRYAATPFLRIAEGSEVVFRVPLETIGGNFELVVQNEDLVTRASSFVRPDDHPGMRELSIGPVLANESLRLCIVIFTGRLALGPVELAAWPSSGVTEARSE
jgi:pyruvyltransferase